MALDPADPRHPRWPIDSAAVLEYDIRGVFAIPVTVAGQCLGALDLCPAPALTVRSH